MAIPTLLYSFFNTYTDSKTLTENQKIEKIFDTFATTFIGSESCVAVEIIRDWKKKVLYTIIKGNSIIF